jgi:pre-rRNA-processing protein TSR1
MSVYGPVTYQPSPVNIFPTSTTKHGEDENEIEAYNSVHGQELALAQDYKPVGEYLAAHGSLMPVDPDRIVLKRIVLTGYPVKVKNRTATVKYMFFDVSLLLASSRLCSKRRLTCFFSHFLFR